MPVDTSQGGKQDLEQAGGRSQAEERLCEAAEILWISRRRKALYGGLFWKIKIMSVPGVELVGEQHQGRALTSEPPRRQDTSPEGGGVGLGGKEACREGRSDKIWRRRPSGSAPPENPVRRVLTNFRAPAARRIRLRRPDPPPLLDTHYRIDETLAGGPG